MKEPKQYDDLVDEGSELSYNRSMPTSHKNNRGRVAPST